MDMTLNKEILSGLFRFCGDAVFASWEGRIVYANDACRKLFARELIGMTASELLPLPELPVDGEAFSSVCLKDVEYPLSIQHLPPYYVVIIPRKQEGATIPGALVQQMRTTAFSLRVALDRLLETAGGRIEPYGSAVLHGYYALLRQIRRMASVYELEQGDMFCRMAPMDLSAVVAELCVSVRLLLGDSMAELLYDVPEETAFFHGDHEKLEQLLLILLLNSLQNTPREGRITVSLRKKGKHYLLSVSDNGHGVPREKLGGLFTPAAEGSLRSTGTGMGLFIAQGIARLHGGAVVLESREEKGTRVCVTLPAADGLSLRDSAPPTAVGPGLLLEELSPVLGNDAYGRLFRD